MTLISIDTSTCVCSAALWHNGELLRQLLCREGGNHAGVLPSYTEELLRLARQKGLQLDAIALSEGPGSYTGLRIGLSTAKGLCYGLEVPLTVIPTTEVLCQCAIATGKTAPGSLLCPMIDARRMEVYTALYRYDGNGPEQQGAIESLIIDEAAAAGPLLPPQGDTMYFFGDGAAKCRALLQNTQRHFIGDIVPEAQWTAAAVESRKARGKAVKLMAGAEVAYYEPFYLKAFVAAKAAVKGLN